MTVTVGVERSDHTVDLGVRHVSNAELLNDELDFIKADIGCRESRQVQNAQELVYVDKAVGVYITIAEYGLSFIGRHSKAHCKNCIVELLIADQAITTRVNDGQDLMSGPVGVPVHLPLVYIA